MTEYALIMLLKMGHVIELRSVPPLESLAECQEAGEEYLVSSSSVFSVDKYNCVKVNKMTNKD